ncbi:MAG TPA: RHS repeat-associated core domain-containing protein, partial [Gemmatimonadales bacterium]|nr:RHS repeat-associated core domain-containing protein [Gemmatimonadales bacterium]
ESSGAVIDSTRADVLDIFAPEPEDPSLWLVSSDPADGALVDVPATVMLRLSRPARADTLTPNTVTLASVSGGVEVRIVSAEQGRLIFVTPTTPLQSNTAYLVTVTGARDTANAPFPLLSVGFTTTDAASAGAAPLSSDDEVWDPRADPGGLTRRTPPESRWRKLPPLMAPPGVTALSGQVLRLNGLPLAGVTLEIEGRSAVTDGTGRFLVTTEVGTGWHELGMDGRRPRGTSGSYGTFEVAVWVTAGRTAVLPYTIWLPKIDTAHAVAIDSPTTSETVVTTPLIPGLELRLPAGTVITDEDGAIVRAVSLTPIPVSQPPFPLAAGVDVPVYFTIQPGGAYVTVAGGGYPRGARLVYPNTRRLPPGGPAEFWHYEPEAGRGWYVYGRGAVTADGRQIVPNPGVAIDEFTGAMAANPALGGGPGAGGPGDNRGYGGEPVHLGTGLFILNKTDLALPDVLPIGIPRTYRTLDTVVRSFGLGATHDFDLFLVGDTWPYTYLDLVLPNGSRVHFPRTSAGTGYLDAEYEHTASPTKYFKSRIEIDGNEWRLDLKDGSSMWFRDGYGATRPAQGAITRLRDRYGNTTVLTRNADADLTRITSPTGRWIELAYDASHRVTQATDNGGRTVGYTYDGSGRLWKVTDPAGGVTEYTYDTSHRLLTIKDARGIVFLTNHYDGNGRVDLQTQADNTTFQFAYTLDAQGRVTQTDLTDPRGFVRRVTYDPAAGYLLTDTAALGTPLARTTTLVRNSNNLVTRVTDGLGRNTDSTYDTSGNVTSVTRLAGTGNAVTTNFTYDATFNLLTSVTDPLTHATTFTRDSLGNVSAITDTLQHQTTFTYNTTGQPLTVTTPAGTATFGYDGGDLVAITDPLGRTTSRFVDSMGRVVRTTNPLGQATTHTYDVLNAVTQTLDALGGITAFTYDANRNLLTLTDALTHTTTYTYNNMDRVDTRTDPLTRGESFTYNGNGALAQHTDRKSQITGYTYDALDRLSTVTYQGGSTTTYTYDAGDRVTQVVDSVAGTITRGWDLLDRLTSETTPEGSVSYTYDAADRRATMTVAGQPQVTYGYDNANRLTSITQNSAVAGFSYDDADRRTVLTLPNGVTVEYGYDAASQVTGLTYKLGAATLGNLTYTYDLAGNRASVGGSWARTGLPSALASATYDAANQIATWGGTAFTYDLNGNLTNDGTKTYTWNTRNQLSALSGGVSASFQYDGLGRRRAKTVTGASTGFLYDGLNTVQELVGGSPSANILPGLGIDEWLTRTDGAGARHFLTDVLGSTLALADAVGAVQTEYTYEAFGKTTVSGATSPNGFQFTGRENDGTGLFQYRARYYGSAEQRFISEDPLGVEGGLNLFAYAYNAPSNLVDALGLDPDPGFGAPPGRGPGPRGRPSAPPGRGPGPRGPGDPQLPDKPQDRCTPGKWGGRMVESLRMTNSNPWFTGTLPGVGMMTSGAFAQAVGGLSPMGWVTQGFGGATMGAATFTGLETGLIVAAGAVGNAAYATGAYEVGVGVGSAIDATFHCFGY